jgi:hypothetical protein
LSPEILQFAPQSGRFLTILCGLGPHFGDGGAQFADLLLEFLHRNRHGRVGG